MRRVESTTGIDIYLSTPVFCCSTSHCGSNASSACPSWAATPLYPQVGHCGVQKPRKSNHRTNYYEDLYHWL
ncbi:hypothetical protein BDV38DRAFT_257781 [Aspergillus pseudotamarii]|uniref:Uncharacterized protein n=1 Tax=Aspergillus pseudotamarii TaxID=132259 RepID=A0A5N6SI99_ASPPS|nr:uncharacterized protein BDV38DRAFT_257781 [Aspergillus pseudotamarii]KAE8133619.1 hypothetical protein BDV38DRAFT_257781 [Aspergillus pseudotamarii]